MQTLLLGDSILRFIPNDIIGEVTNKSSVGKYSWMIERESSSYNVKMFHNVFILIGINDFINMGCTAAKTGERIINAVKRIKEQNPLNLYILGLLPVLEDTNEESEYCNKNIPLINAIVKEYCDRNSIRFFDCYSLFLDKNGKIDKSLFRDGLHPSDKGYKILTKLINTEIKRTKETILIK